MILPINLMLSPPPNQLLIFECHETKNCEIKPAVRVIKYEIAGLSRVLSVHGYDTNMRDITQLEAHWTAVVMRMCSVVQGVLVWKG
jgi:hypothetical protein